MAIYDKPEATSFPVWAGTNNEQAGGDDPYNQYTRNIKNNNYLRYLQTLQQNQSLPASQVNTLPAVTETGIVAQIQNLMSTNPLLFWGGLAVVGYFLFVKDGGGLAESTVVKRYARK